MQLVNMRLEKFIEWLSNESCKYAEAFSPKDSYNRGWEDGYMYAMYKAKNECRDFFAQPDADVHGPRMGTVLVTRYDDGSVGMLIPQPTVDGLARDLDNMAEMYADEERDNWWDADDIARSVAEDIHALLSD